ncbi:DUF2971 domain-containing protein [Pseudomonas oryzae]|uniref:DUF2971 domain-containing protein n=1 Tax=Pseudomonas oryzae TaxID=1392877 RepID=A0A1H1N1Y9_9PSED|nr:DUF2971 domain-containing protein [Pseudomonas oryzae]SDR92927.1 Protein of unknown function [Pseudomonas oryzae]
MAIVKLGSSITSQIPLWRYMSIDKLVNLLEVESLYFTPLSTYAKSDPFEGYLPKVAFEALATVLGSSYKELESVYDQLKILADNSRTSGVINTVGEELLMQLRTRLDSQNDFVKEAYKAIARGITVNCWHSSLHESEAMWRLYSENGKGIAIQTSIDSLKKSIESVEQDLLVQIGAVKYLDFYDQDISPKDCVIDGHLSPLLKRASFSHEKEVRLFTIPEIDHKSLGGFEPKAESIALNAKELIEKIHISPFASEPFISSTIAICKKYGIDPEIITKSALLEGHDELLETLGVW